MTYLYQYLLFLAQAVTVTIAVLVIVATMASLGSRRSSSAGGHLSVVKLNDELEDYGEQLRSMLLDSDVFKQLSKTQARAAKSQLKAERRAAKAQLAQQPADQSEKPEPQGGDNGDADAEGEATISLPVADALPGRPRLFVLDFEGDVQASKVDQLRREVTAVLTVASREDEVLVRVESPGGLVHAYGLAASQLARIRSRGIPLTVAVDKVAASGGYMMAAVANRILSAPFAVLGSIGVVAQIPNVHRLLKKNDVDVEILTAGKYKRTLTVLGENSPEGREKFIEELEVTHELFQDHVSLYRPEVDVDAVATGEAWYGQRAIDLKLVDQIVTSDDYLIAACAERDVFELSWKTERKALDRLFERVQTGATTLSSKLFGRFSARAGNAAGVRASSAEQTLLGRISGAADNQGEQQHHE